jgi:hypothetical protein
MPSAFFASK